MWSHFVCLSRWFLLWWRLVVLCRVRLFAKITLIRFYWFCSWFCHQFNIQLMPLFPFIVYLDACAKFECLWRWPVLNELTWSWGGRVSILSTILCNLSIDLLSICALVFTHTQYIIIALISSLAKKERCNTSGEPELLWSRFCHRVFVYVCEIYSTFLCAGRKMMYIMSPQT